MFTAELIKSDNYQRAKNLLPWVGGACFMIGIILDNVNPQFYVLVLVSWFMYFVYLYIYDKHRVIGTVTIEPHGISVRSKDEFDVFKFSEIDQIEIVRGSRYHYDYQNANERTETKNYVSFYNQNSRLKYEFKIDSKEKNTEFEVLIQELYKSEIPL